MHSEAEALEHTKKRDACHQSVSLENKKGDSTILKIGDSAKVVIKQDMKGRRHKYEFNNNKREKAQKKRVVDDETGDKHQLDEIMGSPPASIPPLPPSPPPTSDESASMSAVKRTRKASRLRSLSTRPPSVERPVVHVDPATGKADDPHIKKLRTYLGIVARDKVDITYENWKEVPIAQKDLIWEDIQAEFDILEASDSTVSRKWGRDGGSLNQTSRGNGPLQPIRTVSRTLSVTNTASARKSGPSFARLAEIFLGRRHVKWKMTRTKKTMEMTTEAAKEIAENIDSFEEQATQGSFVPHGRQDVLAAAIGRPEHPGRVRAAGAGVTIKQYFGSAPRTSRSDSSLPPDELQQLTQQIGD
ncbi:hypothetical protein HKD37_14G040922 [Glycine soja]